MPSDAEALFQALARAARVDPHAMKLEELVTEHFEKMRKSVYLYLTAAFCSPADAEEITQEAFLRLYGSLHKGHTIRNVRSWVLRVAHNLALERYKRPAPVLSLDAHSLESQTVRESKPTPSLNPEQQVLERERWSRLSRAWAELNPQQRQCLRLRVEGLRYREIAEVLGVSVSTVADSLNRSIAKLLKETSA